VVFDNYLLFIGYFTLVAVAISTQSIYTLNSSALGNEAESPQPRFLAWRGLAAECPAATETQVEVGVMPKKTVDKL
jgi:hypothetical protein